MRLITSLTLSAAIFVPLASSEPIDFDHIPEAVLEAFTANLPSPETATYTLTTEDGRSVYEGEIEVDGMEQALRVDSDGVVIEAERDVAPEDLPEAVRQAILAEHASAEITDASEVRRGDAVGYEVDMMISGVEHEMQVTADGQVSHMTGEREMGEHEEEGELEEHEHQAQSAPTPGGGCDCGGTHHETCTCHGEPQSECHCHQ